jgi:hypothetical protein
MKARHATALALVGWYLMTPPPVLSGTTNVIDTGAPLGDWFIKSAFLRFGTKVLRSHRDKKRTGGGKPSR